CANSRIIIKNPLFTNLVIFLNSVLALLGQSLKKTNLTKI
ncbi:hypothetical protein, partial [uncultured Gammaproteobacteria bacterium]